MRYFNPSGEEISALDWYRLAGELGMGSVICESTAPGNIDGDITVRTVYIGAAITGINVRPFRTLRKLTGRRYWTELETYDADTAAMAGHIRWITRLTATS